MAQRRTTTTKQRSNRRSRRKLRFHDREIGFAMVLTETLLLMVPALGTVRAAKSAQRWIQQALFLADSSSACVETGTSRQNDSLVVLRPWKRLGRRRRRRRRRKLAFRQVLKPMLFLALKTLLAGQTTPFMVFWHERRAWMEVYLLLWGGGGGLSHLIPYQISTKKIDNAIYRVLSDKMSLQRSAVQEPTGWAPNNGSLKSCFSHFYVRDA